MNPYFSASQEFSCMQVHPDPCRCVPTCVTLVSTGTVDWMYADQDVPPRIYVDPVSDLKNTSIFCARLIRPTSVSTLSAACLSHMARSSWLVSELWGDTISHNPGKKMREIYWHAPVSNDSDGLIRVNRIDFP